MSILKKKCYGIILRKSTFYVFFLLFGCSVQAQILPPDFQCVKNDTLFWQLPINLCGPGSFRGVEIFTATSRSGPYQLLTTISDPAQNRYFHQNAGSNPRFYYLKSNFDCPGKIALPSDTLNNSIPENGKIDFVTVENQAVNIQWSPSPSSQTVGYVIYRNTSQGTTIIDTVYDGLAFTDTGASPGNASQSYFLAALDACGNLSLISQPHQTIFITTTLPGQCDRVAKLGWNLYENWPQGIEKQEVWVSRNGSNFQLKATLPGNTTSYDFNKGIDGQSFCFFIKAYAAGSGHISQSNEICITFDIIQPVLDLLLFEVNHTEKGIFLQWYWNPDANIDRFTILRSTQPSNFEPIATTVVNGGIKELNTFLDPTAPAGQLYYAIETTDVCGKKMVSNTAGNIFLKVSAQPNLENHLNWQLFFDSSVVVNSQEVYSVGPAGNSSLNTLQGSTNNYIDAGSTTAGASCYVVEVNAEVTLPDGVILPFNNSSNIACTDKTSAVYVPNAFVPDGFNKQFHPVFQLGTPDDYNMSIFDRWGKKIFETIQYTQGWDGKIAGEPAPQGVYMYLIQGTFSDQPPLLASGAVLLLR